MVLIYNLKFITNLNILRGLLFKIRFLQISEEKSILNTRWNSIVTSANLMIQTHYLAKAWQSDIYLGIL